MLWCPVLGTNCGILVASFVQACFSRSSKSSITLSSVDCQGLVNMLGPLPSPSSHSCHNFLLIVLVIIVVIKIPSTWMPRLMINQQNTPLWGIIADQSYSSLIVANVALAYVIYCRAIANQQFHLSHKISLITVNYVKLCQSNFMKTHAIILHSKTVS